ncbi:MAG: pantoate--beta-alanine ligase [Cyclobacteriaceae bacterium]
MQIFEEIGPIRAYLDDQGRKGKSIGLVPTMGALHQGHLSLIGASKSENDLTVGTIYVNPTQFNNPTDLAKYPRSLETDIEQLTNAGCDVLFKPSNEVMYGEKNSLKFDFGQLDKVLEGKFRPGHFSGVALVVSKLFNIIQPQRAYFGQKDYQQFLVISRLVEELKFPLQLKSIPISREASGLALSSRNQRLSEEGKAKALLLVQCLRSTRDELLKGRNISDVRREVQARFDETPGVKLEYLELADSSTLEFLERGEKNSAVILIAGFVDDVRLIDNMLL